ncbi:branched-chain amino acid ABC transporter permease [Starkeya koreensis]|uniref:Branched-chain amino acid ABC transporter permease n=1 Tax=Ancylobacter koreensis TaxID=266121 RepID=A0ABT0DMV4_9HYPH|nr:branched-chain amino acid ABC transporter permease [Ancylobacter koreensis]MCK0208611.1 branched-chain amino acid ABC transporter permease [Ancylobacter koreensis]
MPARSSSPLAHRPSLFRVLAFIALLLLPGCGSVIDADQARLCRAVAPALHDEDTDIVEMALRPVPGAGDTLRYGYRTRGPLGSGAHWISCRFAGHTGAARFDLAAVDTDRGPLSEVKLFILKRWWLAEASEAARPPFFTLGARSAYWLQQALGGLVLAGVYGLIATGFALVHGLYGRVNLAFGEIAVTGGAFMLIAVGWFSVGGRIGPTALGLALTFGILAAALLSWVVGRAVFVPIAERARSPQPVLIGTIAVSIVLAEVLRLTSSYRENWLPALLNRPIYIAGQDGFVATATPAQFLAAGLTLTGLSALLGVISLTSFGRSWRAYADDPKMAALLGVRVPVLVGATFAIAGAAAGLAGASVVIAYGTISPGDGLAITLKALISAIIGGIGSVPGAFLGAALVAGVEIVWSSAFDIAYRDVVIYSLLAAFLVLRPGGLLNRAAPTPREF